MIRNRLLHLAQLSAIGLTGYFVGQNKDKVCDILSGDSVVIDGKRIKSMPGLPVFGTVSAATPYMEVGGKDRVRKIL